MKFKESLFAPFDFPAYRSVYLPGDVLTLTIKFERECVLNVYVEEFLETSLDECTYDTDLPF